MGIKHTKVAGGVDNPAYDVSKGEWNDDHDISTLDIVDLSTAETDDALVLAPDGAGGVEFRAEAGGGGGGVTDADYLVGTSNGSLSAEIVVGTTPGGELGGTWASPTVDATHSGSAHHSAVTVGTGLDLTGQLIDLDLSEVASGGELGGFMDAPTVDASHSGSTHAATQAAAESTAAGALTTHAAAADPHTGYLKESVVSGLAAPGLTLGTTNTAGVALTAIATDSTILAFDATGPAAVGTQAVGAATVAARRDHVHATGAGTPSTQAIGDAAATGSGPAASMTDHKHAMPAFGTGPAAVGTQANGSSANIARIDHVHATGAGTPSTQAFGDAAATGTGPAAAMTDHKHAMPAAPKTVANDTIWDAAGDLVVASGADAAARLAIGTTRKVLKSDGTTAGWAYPSFIGVGAYHSTTQTITTSTETVLLMDTEEFDTDAFHSTSSNTSRITIPTGMGGYYLFVGGATNSDPDAGFNLYWWKNGAVSVTARGITGGGVATTTTGNYVITGIFSLVATDYIELTMFHTAGSNRTASGAHVAAYFLGI